MSNTNLCYCTVPSFQILIQGNEFLGIEGNWQNTWTPISRYYARFYIGERGSGIHSNRSFTTCKAIAMLLLVNVSAL